MKPLPFLALALAATSAFANPPGKYKDWDTKPVSYFMTKAERAQWATIKTDADAETFVKDYLAKRGAGFEEEVAKSVGAADKYLTVGKTPGSQTLRGKVIVLLGPPSTFATADRAIQGPASSAASMAFGVAGDGGASVADMADAAQRSGLSTKSVREFTIYYDARKLPKSFDRDLTLVIDADPVSGRDRVVDAKQSKDLDTLFELAAQSSIKK